MPGFTTHYLFGQRTYQALTNNSLKQLIQKNHTAFSLGLQGPDIFFYYLPEYFPGKKHLGSLAHTCHTGLFLKNLLKSCSIFSSEEEKHIATVYVLGFLGHYTLDTKCHPFIYSRTMYHPRDLAYHGRHIRLETDIDTCLLYFYQRKLPSEFHQDAVIALTPIQLSVVSSLLEYAYNNTYPKASITQRKLSDAIRAMQWGTKSLYDPSGYKKRFIRKLESVLLGYPILSPLIPSDTLIFNLDPLNTKHQKWKNPWDHGQISYESFFDLLEAAQGNYLKILINGGRYFSSTDTKEQEELLCSLLFSLGDRCYHSGLSTDEIASLT